jgi:hypothetical protein
MASWNRPLTRMSPCAYSKAQSDIFQHQTRVLTAAQKRIILSLSPEELKFANPRTPPDATLEVGLRRAP